MRRYFTIALALTIVGTAGAAVPAPVSAEGESTLSGSRSSMNRQNRVARENDFSFLRTPGQVERLVEAGRLVPVTGNSDYTLANVSYPFARPVLKTFIERLGDQYRAACGQKLVVTSLTRPTAEQPRNASPLSVHPAGMAVDLRVPSSGRCRGWLEQTLLSLEQRGLLDVTRERRPPHYHVAVFPEEYGSWVGVQLVHEAAERRVALASQASMISLPQLDFAADQVAAGAPSGIRGPGIFASILLALVALIGGTALLVREHSRQA